MELGRTRFATSLTVRPDDIDMNQHVHASRYQDYVLAARYDQMVRCYGLSMEAFLRRGLAWYVQTAHLEYKRPLKMGDDLQVVTWVQEVFRHSVRVDFEILRGAGGKLACDGWFQYVLVDAQTGRPEIIPDDVLRLYSV